MQKSETVELTVWVTRDNLEFRDCLVNQEREILPCTAPNGSEAQTNVSVYMYYYKL